MNHGGNFNARRWLAASLAAILGVISGPLYAQTYTVTDLGTGDGNDSYGSGINNSGKVAGYWDLVGSPVYNDAVTPFQAAVWDGSTFSNLDPLPGHTQTFAFAINNPGQVAGASCSINTVDCRNVIWYGLTPTDLGPSGGGAVLAINDAAQLAGYVLGDSPMVERAAMWVNGHVTTLSTLTGELNSAGLGINNAGHIAGVIYIATGSDVVQHAVVWKENKIVDLGTNSVANAINERGQVVGYFIDSTHSYFHASLWSDGVTKDLGTLGGTYSQANAINSSGQIVGWSSTAAGQEDATLWVHGKIIDLNSQLPPAISSVFALTSANGINDRGEILAIGYDAQTGSNHIFVLTPKRCEDSDTDSHADHSSPDGRPDAQHDRHDDHPDCRRERPEGEAGNASHERDHRA